MVGLQESRDIHVSVDEGIPQLLGQVYVDIYIPMIGWWDVSERWDTASNDNGRCFFLVEYIINLLGSAYECIGFICYSVVVVYWIK